MSFEDELQVLLDERQITRVLYRYSHGADRGDTDMVVSGYHAGATDHHGAFGGPIEEFRKVFDDVNSNPRVCQHYISNPLIEIVGDKAVCESYWWVYRFTSAGTGTNVGSDTPETVWMGGRYVDRFQKRDGEWKITSRICTTDWSRVLDEAPEWPHHHAFVRGTNDAQDPARIAFAELRGVHA